ncbi:MAG: hypothetical protein GF370_01050, partial [Candidatus Nealsonbacteria bacterium]|nr:hypothetical protein [Candidatus Nealsonbacteria bacterium]
MKKTYLFIGVALVIALALFFFFQGGDQETERLIGEEMNITIFTRGGELTGKASISIPFLRALANTEFINVGLDLDGDGAYSQSEWIVEGFPIRVRKDWNNNFYFVAPAGLENTTQGKVVLGAKQKDLKVNFNTLETGDLFDLASVTNPEEAMKGVGIVYAQSGPEVNVSLEGDVPDITQTSGECGPTAAANSLVHLIQKHGQDEDLPDDLNDFLEELKNDMNWTEENGVLPDDFVTGKNKWAQDNGLPITTEKIGDEHGASTLEEIEDALSDGNPVEMRLKFGDPQSGEAVGGHMVTVTGMRRVDGKTYLDFNDPASPFGTDTVEVEGNQISNYGLFEGWVLVSWAFVQTWEDLAISTGGKEAQPATGEDSTSEEETGESKEPEEKSTEEKKEEVSSHYTYEELADMTPEEIRALGSFSISALSYGGNWFPFPEKQFIPCSSCPGCETLHNHGAVGFSLDLRSVPEPSD